MLNRFEGKTVRCLAISGSSSQRLLLSTVFRDLGFINIVVVADIKSCLEMMEAEEIGWIVTPLLDANNMSALQLLELVNKQPMLRQVKISIFRDENDLLLGKAFAMGAFSCHKFSMSREACSEEFKKLLAIMKVNDGDFTKVAAEYLRDYLLETKKYLELKNLYSGLLQVYPGDPDLLLELAHATLLVGDEANGRILLQQVEMTGIDRTEKLKALCQQFFSMDALPEEPEVILAEHFGFRSCLVVDPTPESLDTIKKSLAQLGFGEVIGFGDPITALKWLSRKNKVDLIISEWKLPLLPGPVFLYKLRNKLGEDIPLLIINEAIEVQEIPLISELGARRLLQKPIDPHQLNKDIIWTLQQHTNPTDPAVLEQKLRFASQNHDLLETKRLKSLYFAAPTLLESDKQLIEAQISFDAGCFLHAKKHALEAMKKGADSRASMIILGKSLMKLREFDAALRCIANVSFISPLNVSHLCDIAEIHLEQGNDAGFDLALEKAQSLDNDSDKVLETTAKGAIKRGHTEMARKILGKLKSLKEVMAFMNNRAVTLIRAGKFQEGIDLYLQTLAALPEGQPEMRALVHYNLGLGLARASRLEEAVKALVEVDSSQNRQRVLSAKSLKTRIMAAISTGEPILLKSTRPVSEKDEKAKIELMRQVEQGLTELSKITRADYCLINIYRTTLGDTEADEFMQKKLTFAPRGKLVKDYRRGLVVEDSP